jgi:hypothetical protein
MADDAGLSHMAKNSVIPTGAERSEAQWRDLFLLPHRHEQVPRLRRPLGGFARDDGINNHMRLPWQTIGELIEPLRQYAI